jgi:hypothetical protein
MTAERHMPSFRRLGDYQIINDLSDEIRGRLAQCRLVIHLAITSLISTKHFEYGTLRSWCVAVISTLGHHSLLAFHSFDPVGQLCPSAVCVSLS